MNGSEEEKFKDRIKKLSENGKNYVVTAPCPGSCYVGGSLTTTFTAKNVNEMVAPGQKLCAIKNMASLKDVNAKKGGKITQILVTDEEVEYGQPLFVIELAKKG